MQLMNYSAERQAIGHVLALRGVTNHDTLWRVDMVRLPALAPPAPTLALINPQYTHAIHFPLQARVVQNFLPVKHFPLWVWTPRVPNEGWTEA